MRVLDVTITGAATLAVGETTELVAKTDAGAVVTVGSDWRTSDLNVATISPLGVLTARRSGTATITAAYRGATGTFQVTVTALQIFSPAIAACGDIVAPGSYSLANDISMPVPYGACLKVLANGVQLDCHGHSLTGVLLTNVSNVRVTNCTFVTDLFGTGQSFAGVYHSSQVTFDHNRLSSIFLEGGSNNTVLDNAIDGGYDGSLKAVGQDDGVVLIDETGDTIRGNTIRNVYDAGIEGVDVVANSEIANNVIVNAADTGIGSYWCTSWTGNRISGNTVSHGSSLLKFIYKVGTSKCVNPSTPGAFADNQFVGNRFFDQTLEAGLVIAFDFPTLPPGVVFNNLIQGNDIAGFLGPNPVPAAGFVNGGRNVCLPNNPFCGS